MAATSWTWASPDNAGKRILALFNYDDVTRLLATVFTTRDIGCVYQNIYFGLGQDGTPNTTLKLFGGLPATTVAVLAATLTADGFSTIDDIWAAQITAGP